MSFFNFDIIGHVLGSGEVEVTETEARMIRASSANSWYRTRERAPVFANFSGRVAWPPSLALLEDQPKIKAGDYVTVVRVAEYCPEPSRQWGLQQSCTIGGNEVIQRDDFFWPSRFLPVAARDEEGTFVMGWMDPRQLMPAAPPPFVGAYNRSLTPGGVTEAAPAYSPMAPLPLPGSTRAETRPLPTPGLTPGGVVRMTPTGTVRTPYAPVLRRPLDIPTGITRPSRLPPVRVPGRSDPGTGPLVVPTTPTDGGSAIVGDDDSKWSTGEKLVVGGVLVAGGLALLAAFGKKKSATRTTNKSKRRNRGPSNGWHWFSRSAAVLIRKGKPVKLVGSGSVGGATSGLERFLGCRVELGNAVTAPRKLVGRNGWAYSVEVA